MGFKELPGWWTHQGTGRVVCLERAWKLCLLAFPHTLPYILLLFGCSQIVSFIINLYYCIFYNKLVLVSKEFLCILQTILVNYWTDRGLWELLIYIQLVGQNYKWPRTWDLYLSWKQSCGREPFNLWYLRFIPSRQCQNWIFGHQVSIWKTGELNCWCSTNSSIGKTDPL